jgi:hypothetical protein
MRHVPLCVVASLTFVLFWATTAQADEITIQITSGFSSPDATIGTGAFELLGRGGFTFIGGFGFSHISPPCCIEPGEVHRIQQSAETSDVGGTVMYAGDTYTDIGSVVSVNQASLSFVSDSFVAPPPGASTTTIIEPFTLSGWFHGRPGDGNDFTGGPATLRATLTGRGIARVSLTWQPDLGSASGGFWESDLPRFDFTSAAPTPEPTSLVLLGLGAAGAWSVRRRNAGTAK